MVSEMQREADLKDSYVDVVIVGAGPAGCMVALWLSRLGISTRIIDKRVNDDSHGQADAFNARTTEILESFDLHTEILRQAVPIAETFEWGLGEEGIYRSAISREHVAEKTSRYFEHFLSQSAMENVVLDSIKQCQTTTLTWNTQPISLSVETAPNSLEATAWPIALRVRHMLPSMAERGPIRKHQKTIGAVQNGSGNASRVKSCEDSHVMQSQQREIPEKINAKYLIGCDGAHSWTRKQLGIKMEGDNTNAVWGVLEIKPVTNFPDIRKCGTIQTPRGSLLIIPRERGLVRLYTQMGEEDAGAGHDQKDNMTSELILEAMRRVLIPYTLDYTHCEWWTCYKVGQRVATNFTDEHRRIFLAGDAVHTHSPKGGLGMNNTLQDAYNLGWKIAGVVKGIFFPNILATYESERRRVAWDIIDLDRKLTAAYSTAAGNERIWQIYHENQPFIAGLDADYSGNMLTSKSDATHSSKYLQPGKRIGDFQILAHADGRLWWLHQLLKSNGKWRIICFAGDVGEPTQFHRVKQLAKRLGTPRGLLHMRGDSIEVLTLHCSDRSKVEMSMFPSEFFPFDEEQGFDYWKIFVDEKVPDQTGPGAYEICGVNREHGCLIMLRPDQHISFIGDFEEVERLEEFAHQIWMS